MTFEKDLRALDVALTYIKKAQSYLMAALNKQPYENDDLFSMRPKEDNSNPTFGFDETSNRLLFETLAMRGFDCHVYSEEEHSWKVIGKNPKYFIICDPFCNSFLASRTFRDAAIAICISDLDGKLAACAIGDLQVQRIYYADQSGAYVLEDYDSKNSSTRKIRVSTTATIAESFIVTPLLKSSRRAAVSNLRFFHDAKILHGVDGAIMIARLAGGYIDAYLDPLKGQPLYEVPCCELIVKAGGIVTNERGHPFQLSHILTKLNTSDKERYKLIAAGSRELHDALLNDVAIMEKGK